MGVESNLLLYNLEGNWALARTSGTVPNWPIAVTVVTVVSPVTIPEVFANANLTQLLSRFLNGELQSGTLMWDELFPMLPMLPMLICCPTF